MTDANLRLCDLEMPGFPNQKPFNLKPLLPKVGEDCYYEGQMKKMKQKKRKTKPFAQLSPPQISSGQHCWGDARAKDISPPLQEMSSVDYEEIQCLSLEDVKVYKKAVPRRMSPMRELWKMSDFPGLQNVGASENIRGSFLSCSCQRHESNGDENASHPSHRVVARVVSTHCQTEDDGAQFRVDISSSTPDAVLCRKIPKELRGTVMHIVSQNHENRSVTTLLSCLFYRVMVNVLRKKETLDTLSASDVRVIESILSDEMKCMTSFSSRSVRGQSRCESLNECFGSLFRRFPGLRALPGFEGLSSSNCPLRHAETRHVCVCVE